jgi:hypothetical protein
MALCEPELDADVVAIDLPERCQGGSPQRRRGFIAFRCVDAQETDEWRVSSILRKYRNRGAEPQKKGWPRSGSFDHFVGAGEQRWRDRQTQRLGGFQIDQELEFCCLINRNLARLDPVEDLVQVIGQPPPETPELYYYRQLIIELVEKSRLPAMYPSRDHVEAGGLMAYGTDLAESPLVMIASGLSRAISANTR